jgi:hypothetical protein
MKSEETSSSRGLRIFLDLLQKFLSGVETNQEPLIAAWREQGTEEFVRFGIFRDTNAYFNLFLSDLKNMDKAVWGRLLQGIAEANVGQVLYLQLKNLSPFKNQLLVFANQLGEARVDDFEVIAAFAESAYKYPYQTVIAVSVAEQEVVVL